MSERRMMVLLLDIFGSSSLEGRTMRTKVCSRCPRRGPQPIRNFAKGKKNRHNWCKVCHNQYNAEYYARNKKKFKEKRQRRRRELAEWITKHKSELKCSRCPENHPACICFHHSDPETKEFSLAEAAHRGMSVERIQAELAKCEVLCMNCHSREHWKLKLPAHGSNVN